MIKGIAEKGPTRASDSPPAPFGAQCPAYPDCHGGCGLGCRHVIESAKAKRLAASAWSATQGG
jgi:hypothetical protein